MLHHVLRIFLFRDFLLKVQKSQTSPCCYYHCFFPSVHLYRTGNDALSDCCFFEILRFEMIRWISPIVDSKSNQRRKTSTPTPTLRFPFVIFGGGLCVFTAVHFSEPLICEGLLTKGSFLRDKSKFTSLVMFVGWFVALMVQLSPQAFTMFLLWICLSVVTIIIIGSGFCCFLPLGFSYFSLFFPLSSFFLSCLVVGLSVFLLQTVVGIGTQRMKGKWKERRENGTTIMIKGNRWASRDRTHFLGDFSSRKLFFEHFYFQFGDCMFLIYVREIPTIT
ncbi:hypothetical protein QBC43DRAFT_108223 [Cladorrhinum sp. PSN259]|nr:hypothetical protein QBC43DRAFT_108223 [Cladorrhinum sp. PSN259]